MSEAPKPNPEGPISPDQLADLVGEIDLSELSPLELASYTMTEIFRLSSKQPDVRHHDRTSISICREEERIESVRQKAEIKLETVVSGGRVDPLYSLSIQSPMLPNGSRDIVTYSWSLKPDGVQTEPRPLLEFLKRKKYPEQTGTPTYIKRNYRGKALPEITQKRSITEQDEQQINKYLTEFLEQRQNPEDVEAQERRESGETND